VSRNRGFTLIELVIVVAIVAILAAIALPSYLSQLRKGRRSDVEQAMLQAAMLQERFRADCPTYASAFGFTCATVATLSFASSPYTSGYYTVTTTTAAGSESTAYTITATASSGKSQVNDTANGTACTPLTYTYSAGTTTKSPSDCWAK